MDGLRTLHALRWIEATAAVPAVFMSAKLQPQEVAFCLAVGAVEVLRKPFDPMTASHRPI